MKSNELFEKIANLDSSPSDVPEAPPPELIAFFVRLVRGLRNWKQTTLADFARISLSTVERVERGERVSDESLDRIAMAFGYDRGYFTLPRLRLSLEQAAAKIAEEYAELDSVHVRPLETQRQIREIAKCHAFLIHRPDVGDAYDQEITGLTEWFDLASYIVSTPLSGDSSKKGGRRELFKDILECVHGLERRGLTVGHL